MKQNSNVHSNLTWECCHFRVKMLFSHVYSFSLSLSLSLSLPLLLLFWSVKQIKKYFFIALIRNCLNALTDWAIVKKRRTTKYSKVESKQAEKNESERVGKRNNQQQNETISIPPHSLFSPSLHAPYPNTLVRRHGKILKVFSFWLNLSRLRSRESGRKVYGATAAFSRFTTVTRLTH